MAGKFLVIHELFSGKLYRLFMNVEVFLYNFFFPTCNHHFFLHSSDDAMPTYQVYGNYMVFWVGRGSKWP